MARTRRRTQSDFLVGKGKMTAGEKDAIANWYLVWGPRGAGLTRRRAQIDKQYPVTKRAVDRLIARGLLEVVAGPSIDITPQGIAVAKMLLGKIKPKRRAKNPSSADVRVAPMRDSAGTVHGAVIFPVTKRGKDWLRDWGDYMALIPATWERRRIYWAPRPSRHIKSELREVGLKVT